VILTVPHPEEAPWPTLGPLVCAWIKKFLVHGPGDLRGEAARIDDEKRALIYRAYEVYPEEHPKAGRRRFRRVGISLRKGSAKSEFAAWLAAAELHPRAPVRCAGFDRKHRPLGRGVKDPYIPLVAYTEEQSEDLVYGALKVILELSPVAHDFDIGLERIMRVGGDGKAVALASAPDARDGARTTFSVMDETHRWNVPRLRSAHRTMLANLPKRRAGEPWNLEITTAPAPGEDSIAERTMEYARAVVDGRIADSELFFFHRQAGDGYDLADVEQVRAAVLEASGPVAEWSDIDGIVAQWQDPTADRTYLERVWLNRLVRSADRAFDFAAFRELAAPKLVPARALITLGFDGSRYNDATALVGCDIATGYEWVLGVWEKPFGSGDDWEVPQSDVEAVMADAFKTYDVFRLYADPPYWDTTVAKWAGEYGEERVVAWPTLRSRKMADAIRSFDTAIRTAELTHDGHDAFVRHIGNCYRRQLAVRDDQGTYMWTIQKERHDSPNKIDVAMAAVLAWEARRDALTLGAKPTGSGAVEVWVA
jgi:phage terminase large subunit-like protein